MMKVVMLSIVPWPAGWLDELCLANLLVLSLPLQDGRDLRSTPSKKCTTTVMCLQSDILGKLLQLQVIVVKSI